MLCAATAASACRCSDGPRRRRKLPMNARGQRLESLSSHLAPPQSEWVFLPRLGGCESLSAALFQGGAVVPAQGIARLGRLVEKHGLRARRSPPEGLL